MDRNETLAKAKDLLETGSTKEAHLLLQPLVRASDPEALFLFSTYSIDNNESDEDFESRCISLLTRASTLGHMKATFALAGYYDSGDMVPIDKAYAAQLVKKAAEYGHLTAKLIHGLDLFYGKNGIPQDMANGRRLIQEAAQAGVEDAAKQLAKLE